MDSIIVFNKVTRKRKEYSYEIIRSQNALKTYPELQTIYENKGDYKITCSCNSNINLHLRNINNKIIVSTNPNSLQLHQIGCLFREGKLNDNQLRGAYYRTLQIVNSNHIRLTVNHLGIVKINNTKKKSNSMNPKNKGYTRSRMTIGSFGRELLCRAWEHAMDNFVQGKYPYPTIRGIRFALKELFVGDNSPTNPKYPLVKVEITKGQFLNDKLILGTEKINAIYYKNKNNVNPVILMPFIKDNLVKDFDDNYHLLKLPSLKTNNEFHELVIEKNEWDIITQTSHTRVNYDEHGQYFIIGLGKINDYGKPPIIYNAELIPTTIRGMFVDSSYENKLFSILEIGQRDFIKPNQLIEELDNLKPDAILRDTELPCIIEVFGMDESNTDYHEHRKKKIEFYESLEDFNFFKWDAYKYKAPGKLPNKAGN